MNIPLVNSDIHSPSYNDLHSHSKENSPLRSPRGPARNLIPVIQLPKIEKKDLPITSQPPSNEAKNAFKVCVRIRPLNSKEQSSNHSKKKLVVTKAEDNMIFLFPPKIGRDLQYKQEKSYIFDKVFDYNISTAEVYEKSLEPAVKNVISGYNSTILAYGMTGAGKTFTMFGDIYNSMGGIAIHPGIVSLVVKDLFTAFEKEEENGFRFKIKLSYLEIYNEHARDLLTPDCEEMMIIEDPQKGIIIPNLSEFPITDHDEIVRFILQGNQRRVMASTHANQFSSRSHAIIQLTIEKRSKTKDIVESFLQSKLSLVDLAGSERAAVSENRGLRQREGANINRSLLALGNCINVLSDSRKKGAFVPYRDSKLTRLLKDSLGGNTRTVMLACISPSYLAYEETSNTLKYASGARNIKRKINKNVKEVELHISEYKGIIESLKAEVHALKIKLTEKDGREIKKDSKVPDFQVKIDNLVDEMGKKLLAIFEESWEISQSINDLKELKEQNEENLKAKVAELESAVGDITLYNRLSEEITALKEVMKNNDNILVEKTASLEKSNQEKKTVQNEIVGIISQFSQSQGFPNDNEENSKHIEKSLKLLEMESDILDHNFLSSKESTNYGTTTTSSESRILNLEHELRKMKKQLEEKDKQLAQNEQLIKTLYQFKEKPKAIKASLLVSPRQGSKNSPMKSRVITNDFLQSESYKLEQSQEASVPVTKKSHNKMKITSPITIKINQPLYNLRSAEKQISAPSNLNSNLNSANTSTIITKLPESKPVTRNGRGESQLQREDSIKKQATLVLEKPQQPSNRGSHKKKSKKNGHDKHRQSFETISIEDLKNYSDKLNKINFDNVEKKSEEKFSYLQHYQNRKKKQEDLTLLRQQSTIYKISDSTHYSTGKPQHQSHINLNNIKSPIKIENEIIASNEPQVALTIENAQDHQQQFAQAQQNAESSSPELSSIGQSYEQSGDLSMKEILLENFSLDQKDKTTLKKDQEKSQRDDKENVQDLESKDTGLIKNDILPQGAYTRQHSSTLPVSKHISHKRNEGLQMIECRNLETSDLKNISSGSKSSEKNIIPGEKIFDLNLQSHQAKVKAVVSNFFTYSKQYYNEDSENKYSKRYEIIKGKKAAKGAIHERSQQFLDTGNNLIYEVNSLVSLRSPKKAENLTETNISRDTRFNYTIADSTNTSLVKDTGRHGIKSLETMRELVKGFRAKLHGLSALVNNNALSEAHYNEINNFLIDYKMNCQTYPLSNADLQCLRRLEEVVMDKINSNESLQPPQITNSYSLQQLTPGDIISIVNSADISREVQSESNTHREEAQEERGSKTKEIDSSIIENVIEKEQEFCRQETQTPNRGSDISNELGDEKHSEDTTKVYQEENEKNDDKEENPAQKEENADERKSSIDLIEENNSKEEQQLVQNFNDHETENNFPDPLKNDQFVSENGFSEDIQEENK